MFHAPTLNCAEVAVNHLMSLALRDNVQVSTDNAHYQGMYPPRFQQQAEGSGAVLTALFTPLAHNPCPRGIADVVDRQISFYFAYLRLIWTGPCF